MFQQDLAAHQHQNDAAGQFRTGFVAGAEPMADGNAHGRKAEGDHADEADGGHNVHRQEGEGHAHGPVSYTHLLGEAGGAELADAPAALIWLRLALVPAVGEELLFRGLMQGYLRPWGSRAAVWGQAVLFALLHGDAPACLSALLSGLALGLCAETSGSLLPGMAFHLYNNTLALLSQTGAGSAWVQPLLLFGLPAAALVVWAIKPGRPPRCV